MIDGVGAEIFSSNLLMNISSDTATDLQKEHLHLNFYDYENRQAVDLSVKVDAPTPLRSLARPEYVLDINSIEQYPLIRRIYKNVCLNNDNYSTSNIIEYLDEKGS